MRLIAISKLREAAAKYPSVATTIEDFYQTLKKAQWKNLEDVKQTFSLGRSRRQLYRLQLQRKPLPFNFRYQLSKTTGFF